MPPSAMIGTLPGGGLGRLVDRGDLRHAHARDHPRRADRARPDSHLDGVGPRLDQGARSLAGGHVAGHDLDVDSSFLIRRTVSITFLL